MQCQCEGGVTGWQGLVQSRFGLVNQWFDVVWRKAEAAIVVVLNLVQDRVRQVPSKTRNLIAPAALQQTFKATEHICVVIDTGRVAKTVGVPSAVQLLVVPTILTYEVCTVAGKRHPIGSLGKATGIRQAFNGQTIPSGDHFVVDNRRCLGL